MGEVPSPSIEVGELHELSDEQACALVDHHLGAPSNWRRLFILAVYTFTRTGELTALDLSDIDLEHGTIHVHRWVDRVRKRKTGATKTETARRIPIEPALRPLLEAIYIEARGQKPSSKAVTGHLLRMPSVGVLSSKLKFYLRQAGIERADLHSRDETRKAMTLHDLRATGITWMAEYLP